MTHLVNSSKEPISGSLRPRWKGSHWPQRTVRQLQGAMKMIYDLSVVVVIHLYVFVKIYQMNTLYCVKLYLNKVYFWSKKKKSQFTKWWVYQTYNLSTRSSTEAPFTWCLGSSNTSQAVLTVGAHSSHNFQAPSGSLAEFLWTFSSLFHLFSGWKGHICEAASPRGQMCSRLSSRDSLTITPAVRWWRWGHTIP